MRSWSDVINEPSCCERKLPMPTYEFECKKCGHEFTLEMAMHEHEKKKVRCPKCKSEEVKHVIASVFVTTSHKS